MSKLIAYYTGLTPSQMVEEFDREISPYHQADFYSWVDKRFNNLWTRERDDFYLACDIFAAKGNSYENMGEWKRAMARYFKTMIDCLPEYRKLKGLDEASDFIKSLTKEKTHGN